MAEVNNLSEQYFLQKCIISTEDAKGSYAMMGQLDIDEQIKQIYNSMMVDIGNHLAYLNNRLNHLKQME